MRDAGAAREAALDAGVSCEAALDAGVSCEACNDAGAREACHDGIASEACTDGLGVFVSVAARSSSPRIGIMGGTFDPIHLGHLECAAQAADQLRLDAVVFVPAGNPHFKQGTNPAPATDRLAMCELACLPNPAFLVSEIEVARPGITYTIDTARALRAALPESCELFFILGSDAFLTLDGWRGGQDLGDLVRFAVLMRPGDDCESVERYRLAHDFSVEMVACPQLDISSSYVREALARGASVRYLVPDAVCSYLHARGLYRATAKTATAIDGTEPAPAPDAGAAASAPTASHEPDPAQACLTGARDIYSQEFAQALRAELATRVSAKRLDHIEGVSQTAARLARAYGASEHKAALAGLLHDWDKGYDDEGIRARVRELGLEDVIDPYVVEHMPQVLHGPTAAVALVRRFPQLPPDVVRAIYNHTTASTTADDLEKIVYIADAIEPSRRFEEAESLRDEVGKVSLDDLFFDVYKFWTLALLKRDKVLHPDTMTIWNSLAAARRARKKKANKEKGR